MHSIEYFKLEKITSMRIGFLVWNDFQFHHFRTVLDAMPTAVLFIDMRLGWHRHFPTEVLVSLKNPVVKLRNSNLRPISSLVDVLVVQSNTNARAQLSDVKIVALQYSLSKEWHQYGKWMQEADLALCFGEYSKEKIGLRVPVISVGNPRMDDYFAGCLDEDRLTRLKRSLDPDKPTIMLAPSWNDQATVSRLKSARSVLSKTYNVIWSPHHNTRIFRNFIQRIFRRPIAAVDEYLYSMKLADVLVSDTSGALFDAIHAGKHTIITDFSANDKMTQDSIEFTHRHMIGPVARSVDEIEKLTRQLLSGELEFKKQHSELRANCFCCDGGAAPRIVSAINRHFNITGA